MNSVMQEFSFLFCGCSCWLDIKRNRLKDAQVSAGFRIIRPCCIFAWSILSLAVVYFLQCKLYFAAYKTVVCVAVCTWIALCTKYVSVL